MDLQTRLAQRELNQALGYTRIAEIAAPVNGSYYNSAQELYLRAVGSVTNGTTIVSGNTFTRRVRVGTNIMETAGRKVVLQMGWDGREEVVGNIHEDLTEANIPPQQLNANNPSATLSLSEKIINLASYPNGDDTVRVMPGVYRKTDGDYAIFSGNSSIDLLTSYTPATAGNQLVACLWLDESTNTIAVTASSEVSQDTDLKAATGISTAETLINECEASAPANARGIWSYIINDDTTALTDINKFHDLRNISGGGVFASSAGSGSSVDALEVTNTAYTALTNTSATQFSGFNTTPVVNTDSGSAVFTAFATDGVTCVAGTYRVTVQVYYTGGNARFNCSLRVTIDGTAGGAIGAHGYLRNASGHSEASNSVTRLVTLGSAAKIGFEHQRISGATSAITMAAGESAMTIERIA